jgi:hypothetical protein
MSSSAISRWVATGRLHRRHHGVYTYAHTALSREGELLAAVFACGAGALLSHFAAAELWRVRRRVPGEPIDVLVPRTRAAPGGVRVHKARTIDPRDRAKLRGIPLTSVPRLLVDLSDRVEPLELANVIHEADFRGRFDRPAVQAAIERATGRRRLGVLEQAIAYHLNGSAGFKSGNEKRSFALLDGLPEPLVNVGFEGLEIDFRWPELHVAVEVDGSGHGRARTEREDAAVDLALRVAGYTVLRFSVHDLDTRPEWVRETTGVALGKIPRGSPATG